MQNFTTRNIVVNKDLQTVFELFSTPKSLEHFLTKKGDALPISDVEISEDTISFKTKQLGKLAFKRSEVDAPNLVKYEGTHVPVPITLTANMMEGATPETTNLQISVDANIPSFLKGMVSGKIEPALEKVANVLEVLDVDRFIGKE